MADRALLAVYPRYMAMPFLSGLQGVFSCTSGSSIVISYRMQYTIQNCLTIGQTKIGCKQRIFRYIQVNVDLACPILVDELIKIHGENYVNQLFLGMASDCLVFAVLAETMFERLCLPISVLSWVFLNGKNLMPIKASLRIPTDVMWRFTGTVNHGSWHYV